MLVPSRLRHTCEPRLAKQSPLTHSCRDHTARFGALVEVGTVSISFFIVTATYVLVNDKAAHLTRYM